MNKKNLRYQNIWIFIGCFMIAFVVFETLTSSPIKPGFKISDKFMHIVGYFGMMGWFVQIFQKNRERLVLAIGFVILGIMLEFIQGWGGVTKPGGQHCTRDGTNLCGLLGTPGLEIGRAHV